MNKSYNIFQPKNINMKQYNLKIWISYYYKYDTYMHAILFYNKMNKKLNSRRHSVIPVQWSHQEHIDKD